MKDKINSAVIRLIENVRERLNLFVQEVNDIVDEEIFDLVDEVSYKLEKYEKRRLICYLDEETMKDECYKFLRENNIPKNKYLVCYLLNFNSKFVSKIGSLYYEISKKCDGGQFSTVCSSLNKLKRECGRKCSNAYFLYSTMKKWEDYKEERGYDKK